MNYTIHTNYENRTEYYSLDSLWAANLIASKFKKGKGVKSVYIVENSTMEIISIY